MALNSEPTATTTVMYESPDTDLVKLTSGTPLTFTTSDWNIPQPVDVEVADNQIDEGGRIRAHRLLLDVMVGGTATSRIDYKMQQFINGRWVDLLIATC